MALPRYVISPSALKTAWRMIDTIFRQHQIVSSHQNSLLTLITIASLFDLLGVALQWRKAPPPSRLVFGAREVVLVAGPGAGVIKTDWSEEEVEAAIDEAEELMDRYGLNDEERGTLYTALPCVGIHALKHRLNWTRKPPFPEVN